MRYTFDGQTFKGRLIVYFQLRGYRESIYRDDEGRLALLTEHWGLGRSIVDRVLTYVSAEDFQPDGKFFYLDHLWEKLLRIQGWEQLIKL